MTWNYDIAFYVGGAVQVLGGLILFANVRQKKSEDSQHI